MRIAVDDGVAHDVDANTGQMVERGAQIVEIEALGLHQRQQFFDA